MKSSQPMSAAEWAMLLALAAVWGGSFFFNALALRDLPVLTVVLGRTALAALALWAAIAVLRIAVPRDPRAWRAFAIMGLLNNAVPFGLIVAGQTQLASGVAAILNAATPVFAVLFAHLADPAERLTPARAAGCALGFARVAVMIGAAQLGAGGAPAWAYAAALGAAASYALAGRYGRRFAGLGVAPLVTAAGQVTASSLLLLPLVLLIDRPWTLPAPGGVAVLALIAVALVSTALAYVLYFRLLATAGATNLMLVTLLVPVGAVLLGVAVLGETLLPRHAAGMTLIAFGLAAVDGRPLALLRLLLPTKKAPLP